MDSKAYRELFKQIDLWVSIIWEKEIKNEYNDSHIPKESVLLNSFYFHLRNKIENSNKYKRLLSIFAEMPLKLKDDRNLNIDLVIMTWDRDQEEPKEILSALEFKYYDYHINSVGIKKDFENLWALKKGVYYRWGEKRKVLKAKKAYFLYLIDRGDINFDTHLSRKKKVLQRGGYCKFFIGYGSQGRFTRRG